MSTKSDLNEAAQQRSRTESKKNDESQRPKCASQVDLHESTTEPRVTRRRFALLTGVFRVLPTFLVIGALAGLGYFGHHHGWQVPKFSELAGNGNVTGLAWCDEHGVPEEICVACDAELMPKGTLYGWCKEHGVAECLLEHPELAQLKDSVTISSEDLDRARRALATRERNSREISPRCLKLTGILSVTLDA